MHCLTDYDPKILVAFNLALDNHKGFSDFLLNNGFPELAALASAIHSDTDALQWLLDHGYPEFAILSNAIDNEEQAIAWLEKHQLRFLSLFAAACRKEEEAFRWFVDQRSDLFMLMIQNIQQILLYQAWDSSDVHKLRRS